MDGSPYPVVRDLKACYDPNPFLERMPDAGDRTRGRKFLTPPCVQALRPLPEAPT